MINIENLCLLLIFIFLAYCLYQYSHNKNRVRLLEDPTLGLKVINKIEIPESTKKSLLSVTKQPFWTFLKYKRNKKGKIKVY